jgi:hypothetical protein
MSFLIFGLPSQGFADSQQSELRFTSVLVEHEWGLTGKCHLFLKQGIWV